VWQPDQRVDFVLLGLEADQARTLEIFHQIKAEDEHLPVVIMEDRALGQALEAELERGCIARLTTPIRHKELQSVLRRVEAYQQNRHLSGVTRSIELFRNLVGTSPAIRHVRRLIEQVAATDASVLLSGESGTGKEVVARNIHYQSKRRYKPFVPVNCGAIHPELLESELFGHEKGAFTGAISSRRGRFEMADGGTLFLDEIGDMPLEMQVKLLRVIQERSFEHVGSNKSITMDVRIISASHVDLEAAIRSGRFREDLYYRLSVFPIDIPSMRDRLDDLPLLVNDVVNRMASEQKGSLQFTREALACLSRYSWPGNVRELANLVERLLILYPDGVVDADRLPDKYRGAAPIAATAALPTEREALPAVLGVEPSLPKDGIDLKEHLVHLEHQLIEQALEESDWVVAHAAKRLNLGRTTLVEKMRKFGIGRPSKVSNI
jgi:sigma-54 specific flagellar transcriptional regulator A